MRKIADEAKLLHYMELAILAYGKGVNRLFGFSMEQVDLSNQKEVLLALHKMYQKGIYTREGDSLRISKEYDLILNRMKEAKTALVVEASSDELPMICCYPGDDILVSEITALQADTVRLSFVDKTAFGDYLMETGYLPELMTEEPEQEKSSGWTKIADEAEEEEKIILSIKNMDADTGECLETVSVTELLIGYRMIMKRQEERFEWKYSPSGFNVMMSELLGGQKK
jgi:hydrogenase maturation factor